MGVGVDIITQSSNGWQCEEFLILMIIVFAVNFLKVLFAADK